MRIVAIADLHLDLPFRWSSASTAARLRRGIRASLEAALELAAKEQADAVLLAGDIYEHDRATLDTAQFLLRVLAEANMPVLVAPGNHDHYSSDSIWATRKWSSNVHIFTEPCFKPKQLSSDFTIWGAAHNQPAGTKGFFADGFHVEGEGAHLALFHGSEQSGFSSETSQKQPHAPFIAEHIFRAGLTHAVVGHYHLARDAENFTYPGTTSFQSFDSIPGGVVVLDFDRSGLVERRRFKVDPEVVSDLELDVTQNLDASSIQRALDELLEGILGVVRVTLIGEQASGVALDLRALEAMTHDDVRIRSEVQSAYDFTSLADESTVRGEFVRRVQASEAFDESECERILVTGLRALDGRVDLEVP